MAVSQSASSGSLCPSVMGLVLISCEHLSASIRICLPHFTVWELSDSNPIWVEDIFLSVCELNGLYATLLNLLDSAVGEDALLVSILKYALDGAVRETKTELKDSVPLT